MTTSLFAIARRGSTVAAVGLALVVGPALTAHAQIGDGECRPITLAIWGFEDRVSAYAALRERILSGPLPPLEGRTSISVLLTRTSLASGIRAARAGALSGDIFGPVANEFRCLISEALRGRDIDAVPRDIDEEMPPMLSINEPYPIGPSHRVPWMVAARLGPLPEYIQYRVVGGDLVLWDAYAAIVIDVLPDAFSRDGTR